jgi:hypothetical protein
VRTGVGSIGAGARARGSSQLSCWRAWGRAGSIRAGEARWAARDRVVRAERVRTGRAPWLGRFGWPVGLGDE